MRQAFRTLVRNPRFTVLACAMLVVGIGLNTAVFSVVNAVLLRPLPYKDSERLVVAGAKRAESDLSYPISPAEFWDWRQQSSIFEELAAYASGQPALMIAGEPMMVRRAVATASLFSMLGIQPRWGRTFTPDEEEHGDQIVLLTHGFWMRAFGGDPRVVGRAVTLDGAQYTVIGVLPADFHFFLETDIWTLVNLPRQARDRRAVAVIGKLRTDVSVDSARAELNTLAHRLEVEYPHTNKGFTGTVITPLRNRFIYKVRQSLNILWAAVAFVLLIVCGNIGSLQVARSEVRYKEFAIRSSMGASQRRILTQLLTESGLIAVVGGCLGMLLAIWVVHIVTHSSVDLPRSTEIRVDSSALLFCLGISALTALLCSIIPLAKIYHVDLANVLKDSERGASLGWGASGMLGALVVGQTALTLVLVTAAALLVYSFSNLQRVDLGFRTDNLATIGLKLPRDLYAAPFLHAAVMRKLDEELQRLPGVVSAGATNGLPIVGQAHNVSFKIRSVTVPPTVTTQYRFVTPGYFQTMGVALIKGRRFTEKDDRASQPVCIINMAMARQYWPNSDPLGSVIQLPERLIPGEPWMEIVGIVSDVRQLQMTQEAAPEISIPITQSPNPSEMTFVIRTHWRDASLANALRTTIRGVDKNLPLSGIEWMDDLLSRTTVSNRFSARVLTAFAGFALFMVACGMYAVISLAVSYRTRDMAIRLALGATGRDLVYLVLGRGATMAGLGIVIGLIGVFVLSRFIVSVLYEVKPLDPRILTAVILVVWGTVLIACYLPARKLLAVDPARALRYE